jgi:predicted permease
VRYNVVSSGYVEAVGVPLKHGRAFTRADARAAAQVVIVNEALARRHFGDRSPVGERLWVGHAPDLATTAPRTIVGVVGNTRIERLEDEPEPAAFVPLAQQEFGETAWRTLFLVAHTEGDPRGQVPAIRAAIAGVDRDLALTGIETMQDRLETSLWRHRLSARVVAAFGLAALAIAVLGVFGIVGYLVSQRAHEIGVRMALGATRERISRMVVGEALRLILLGVCLGAAGALALGRTLSGLLYGVRADDPVTFAAQSLLLVAAALLACLVPAARAARLSPLAAIRRD